MEKYRALTIRKEIVAIKNVLGFTQLKKVFIYPQLLKWYLNHGLEPMSIHKIIPYYKSSKLFLWSPRRGDQVKLQLGDINEVKRQQML